MNRVLSIVVCALIASVCVAQLTEDSQNGGPAQVGDVVFAETFNDANYEGWTGNGLSKASIVIDQGKNVLQFSTTTKGDFTISYSLPNINYIEGTTLKLQTSIKAVNVAVPAQTYHGIKFMMVFCNSTGTPQQYCVYSQKTRLWGTFGWNSTIADWTISPNSYPLNMGSAKIVIGLDQTTGTVLFDRVTLTVVSSVPYLPATSYWNLTTSCTTRGIGIIKPRIDCPVTVPAGFSLPNTFQIKIGSGPYDYEATPSYCALTYFPQTPNQISVQCAAFTPEDTGPRTWSIYARSSITQSWILTKSTVRTEWSS